MERVILSDCKTYDPKRIKAVILNGMDALGVQPHGRTLIKPNLVMPHRRHFSGCYTRPEFLDGLLGALKQRDEKLTELSVGERCGLTIPSRYAFANAGYPKVLRKHRVKGIYFDEVSSVPVPLKNPNALRPLVYVPEPITRCEFLVNAPKFKMHTWLMVTFALKNLIGIQDDAHRLLDHNWTLPQKIVDLQEVIHNGFIAIDAIEGGEYSEIASVKFPLGLIVMGTNPVAVDAVCTRIVGLDPMDIEYIRLASERGYGPVDLDAIEVMGDVTLVEAQQRVGGILQGFMRVDDFLNKKSNLTVYLGKPPHGDYCSGGCPGAVVQAFQIAEVFQPGIREEIKPLSFIIGAYEGAITPRPGEKLIALGDCTCWSGQVNSAQVDIPFIYKTHTKRDPHNARTKDVLGKTIAIMTTILRQRKQPVITVRGCPVPVLENTYILATLGGAPNPSMRADILPRFMFFLMLSKFVRIFNRLFRKDKK